MEGSCCRAAAARSRPSANASKRAGATTFVSSAISCNRPPSESAGTEPSRSPARTLAADHRWRCPLWCGLGRSLRRGCVRETYGSIRAKSISRPPRPRVLGKRERLQSPDEAREPAARSEAEARSTSPRGRITRPRGGGVAKL